MQPPILHVRKSSTIDKHVQKISIDLAKIQKDFNANLANIKSKFDIVKSLLDSNKDAAEDILRSQIVFLDSALDFYIHEIAKYGMSQIINDDWQSTVPFNKYKISMEFAKKIIKTPENLNLFLEEIEETNQKNCFMKYKNIERQLELIGIKINKEIEIEKQIDSLFTRRNEIAHQADVTNGKKNSISESDVNEFISCVEKLQKAIQNAVVKKEM